MRQKAQNGEELFKFFPVLPPLSGDRYTVNAAPGAMIMYMNVRPIRRNYRDPPDPSEKLTKNLDLMWELL